MLHFRAAAWMKCPVGCCVGVGYTYLYLIFGALQKGNNNLVAWNMLWYTPSVRHWGNLLDGHRAIRFWKQMARYFLVVWNEKNVMPNIGSWSAYDSCDVDFESVTLLEHAPQAKFSYFKTLGFDFSQNIKWPIGPFDLASKWSEPKTNCHGPSGHR